MRDPDRRRLLGLAGAAALVPAARALGAGDRPTTAAVGVATDDRGTAREPAGAPVPLDPTTDALAPFKVAVPVVALDDLKDRLRRTRLPEAQTVGDWSQGVPLAATEALLAHWRDAYDWRRFEQRINAFPQFRTNLDGLGIHFVHARSPHADALPILITHGWPGSVVEFLEVIDPLRDPTRHGGRAEDAFHVVVPSLPGFGFSDRPAQSGWTVLRVARAWATLMQRLGYGRWVAQGGDWGSTVTHTLAKLRPPGLVAAHVNWPLVFPDPPPGKPTPAEREAIEAARRYTDDGFGYFKAQATRPQTIGYALTDSPVGQATWIYEKFQEWTDNRGRPEDALSRDAMLDNITLYWLTATAASSARMYWENSRGRPFGLSAGRIELPMAGTVFPREIYRAPRAWAEKLWPNLIYWNEVDRGGHFAAFEQPAIFVDEVRRAFRTVRR